MANIQMQCLSERFITFTELNKNKRCDKRYPRAGASEIYHS